MFAEYFEKASIVDNEIVDCFLDILCSDEIVSSYQILDRELSNLEFSKVFTQLDLQEGQLLTFAHLQREIYLSQFKLTQLEYQPQEIIDPLLSENIGKYHDLMDKSNKGF